MARGNQRDKAREKTQKEAAGKVCPAHSVQDAQTDRRFSLETEKQCTLPLPPPYNRFSLVLRSYCPNS